MSMNSFSFRATKQTQNIDEEEVSALLDLHPEGEAIPVQPFRFLSELEYQPLDFTSLRNEWRDSNGRRSAPRYELVMTVLMANHIRVFRTQSQNLSATGLLLVDLLPIEFSQGLFEIVLIHSNENEKKSFLTFRGKTAGGDLRSRRVQFEALTANSQSQLQQLFQGLAEAR